jgi:hypothetical protein
MKRPSTRSLIGFLLLLLLVLEGVVLGQSGIPIEDGGEIMTAGALGGLCHPPGMPLLALLSRVVVSLAGESGLRMLFALCAGLSLWMLFRKGGPAALFMAACILAVPAFRQRMLQWDAYGLLFLAGSAILTIRTPMGTGYLAGVAAAAHPQGILLSFCASPRRKAFPEFMAALLLGLSLFLALPVLSSAGTAVDWGSPSALGPFLRQVTARGYAEVYGSRMGLAGLSAMSSHLRMLGSALWPAVMLPAAVGAALLFKRDGDRLFRLLLLILIDAAFVLFVNPMAAGSTQTGWMSLLAVAALCAAAAEMLPGLVTLLMALAIGLAAFPQRASGGLPDQEAGVAEVLSSMPQEACLFLGNNDLLYGGWAEKYCRDRRPDLALLSTGNFSAWFEDMACRYAPGLDLSSGISEVGGVSVGRDSAARGLIRLTARDNPGRRIIVIEQTPGRLNN